MTWVYFAQINDNQIKIGETTDLVSRMADYRRGTIQRNEVKLLAAVLGSRANEGHIQRAFKKSAMEEMAQKNGQPTENFRITWDLTDYIRWLRDEWYCIDNEKAKPEETGRESYDAWQPILGRRTRPHDEGQVMFPAEMLEFPVPTMTPDDYWTNPKILVCVRNALGKIDLDPASHREANKNVKAERFFNCSVNGLEQPWSGRVWLNPPFSQWRKWVPKITKEWESGRVLTMCVLSATRTTTAQYFRGMLDLTTRLCITHGRIPFLGLGAQPDEGHVIYYLGNEPERFEKAFASIGTVWATTRGTDATQ